MHSRMLCRSSVDTMQCLEMQIFKIEIFKWPKPFRICQWMRYIYGGIHDAILHPDRCVAAASILYKKMTWCSHCQSMDSCQPANAFHSTDKWQSLDFATFWEKKHQNHAKKKMLTHWDPKAYLPATNVSMSLIRDATDNDACADRHSFFRLFYIQTLCK